MPTLAPASDPPFYGIFVPSKVPLRKILMTSLRVIWSLVCSPPIKNPGYAYVPRQCFFVNFNDT